MATSTECSLDDLLAEYEISFAIEFVTNPDGPHSHLKLIRQRMTKFLDDTDAEVLSNLDIYTPIHLVFSSDGFNHSYLASNLRDGKLAFELVYSIGSLFRGIFMGDYRLIRLKALSEFIIGCIALLAGLIFWLYAIFVISWLYVLISPFCVIALVLMLILIHERQSDLLGEHVLRDEEFARQALLNHWVVVRSTDK